MLLRAIFAFFTTHSSPYILAFFREAVVLCNYFFCFPRSDFTITYLSTEISIITREEELFKGGFYLSTVRL